MIEKQCSIVHEEKCEVQYEPVCDKVVDNVCNTVTENQCHTVEDRKCETEYLLKYEDLCQHSNEDLCSTKHEEECKYHEEPQCDISYETVEEEVCNTVDDEICTTLYEEKCEEVKDECYEDDVKLDCKTVYDIVRKAFIMKKNQHAKNKEFFKFKNIFSVFESFFLVKLNAIQLKRNNVKPHMSQNVKQSPRKFVRVMMRSLPNILMTWRII